jgi:hypothetical protein
MVHALRSLGNGDSAGSGVLQAGFNAMHFVCAILSISTTERAFDDVQYHIDIKRILGLARILLDFFPKFVYNVIVG